MILRNISSGFYVRMHATNYHRAGDLHVCIWVFDYRIVSNEYCNIELN